MADYGTRDTRLTGREVGGTDVLPFPSSSDVDPSLLQFAVQLALTNRNIAAASRAIGWTPEKGRRIVRDNPQILEVAAQATELAARHTLKKWTDLHAAAIEKIESLMSSADDEKVQLKAAEMVIERVEGRVPQKVEVEDDDIRDLLAQVTMRFIAALQYAKGLSYAEAALYADKNPEQVEKWGRDKGLLVAGDKAS